MTHQMLSNNIDGYKWAPLVGQLISDVSLIIEILRINFLIRIYFSID